jgi:hypothetical protein
VLKLHRGSRTNTRYAQARRAVKLRPASPREAAVPGLRSEERRLGRPAASPIRAEHPSPDPSAPEPGLARQVRQIDGPSRGRAEFLSRLRHLRHTASGERELPAEHRGVSAGDLSPSFLRRAEDLSSVQLVIPFISVCVRRTGSAKCGRPSSPRASARSAHEPQLALLLRERRGKASPRSVPRGSQVA